MVFGPDPIDPEERPGVLETLLPWPVRLLLTFGTWLIAATWYQTGPARQLAWALSYAGSVAVSLAVSLWWFIFIANAILGGLWLALTFVRPPDPDEHPLVWGLQHGVEFANRQLSHIEAFWVWMAIVLAWKPRINYQLPALVGLILLGPSLINWIASVRHPEAGKAAGELQVARRPFIYGATLLGLAIIVLRSLDAQIFDILPLAYAIALGAILRLVRHRQRRLHASAGDPKVQAFRRAQRQLTRRADVGFGPVLAVASLLALVGLSVLGRRHLDASLRSALDGPAPAADACVPEQGGPAKPEVTLFLVGDSHNHELDGQRFAGQTELADALATSALRPVEQDMLSAVTVARFGRAFAGLIKSNKDKGPVFWAHLGDLADLSCTAELARAFQSFSAFPADRLAGLASGNHDIAFTGNFFWSPFWTPACQPAGPPDKGSPRLDKATSIAMMKAFALSSGIEERGGVVAEAGTLAWPHWLGGRAGALVTVTPLGPIQHRNKPRGLVGIFIDSTDGRALDWGIAGLFGSFSKAQDRKLRAMVADLPARAGELYRDPVWLIFAHHRVGDLAGPSRRRLESFLTWLDQDPLNHPAGGVAAAASATWQPPPEPRTLAIITAHTHVAESHRHCIGKRVLREIVVGSVIDPPQQAAVLEVGADATGVAAARLRTLPAVGRPGFTCEGEGARATLDAAECRQVIASLKKSAACEPLFAEPTLPGPDCGALERLLPWDQRVRSLATVRGVFEPAEIRDDQVARAHALLACVCRSDAPGAGGGSCQAVTHSPDPFLDAGYAEVMRERIRGGGEAAEKELVCLSWAAAAVEQYKAAGMTFPTALRCAFDDPVLPAAQESVASLEMHPCR